MGSCQVACVDVTPNPRKQISSLPHTLAFENPVPIMSVRPAYVTSNLSVQTRGRVTINTIRSKRLVSSTCVVF